MVDAAVEWRGFSFRYNPQDRAVLQDLHLRIDPGQFILVAGPSGAGKSTLLRTVNGLVPHFSGGHVAGSIRVCGSNPLVDGPHGMSAKVGFVQQDPESQFVVETVQDELAFAMENRGWSQQQMGQRIEEILEQLGLQELRGRRILQLSAGQKQRVAIGSALALRPQILVLDEPTSQLDPESAEDALTALRQLNRELGLTVLVSEHRLERVAPFADRVLYLPGKGSSPLFGPPREVLPRMSFAPPVVELGSALQWQPLPLTVEDAMPFADRLELPEGAPFRAGTLSGPSRIEVEGLGYSYGRTPALEDLRLQARPGELVVLTGRNGSGKTTLLKHLVGLLQPARGAVHVHGMSTAEAPIEQIIRHVGYVPQDPGSLLFADSVRQELDFTRRAHGLPPADAGHWLELLGIRELADRYPRDLSVGERQRVALGAILAAEPATLLLDEPTRGLDPLQKGQLADFLREQTRIGHTIVMSTHDVELAARCADRLWVLEAGRLLADGPAFEVMWNWPVYRPQMVQLFGRPHLRTVADVLETLA